MTSVAHRSGTDRLAEVATLRGWAPREVVVNVQGDEPLLPPELVRQAASLLQADPAADIATLATPVTCIEELLDPSAVKVVRRGDGHALYFSRAPVPWHRDGAPAGITSQTDFRGALRHIGLYAYRVQALARLAAAPPSPLEEAESLEQLRALERGMTILVGDACVLPGPGVDTQADLERVRALVQAGE